MRIDRRAIVGEHGIDRRQHVLGLDLRKRRQGGVGQQGIGLWSCASGRIGQECKRDARRAKIKCAASQR